MTGINRFVDMGGYTSLGEGERLPSFDQVFADADYLTSGRTPLDDMHLEDQLDFAQKAKETGVMDAIIGIGDEPK